MAYSGFVLCPFRAVEYISSDKHFQALRVYLCPKMFFAQRERVKYSPAQRTFGRHGRLKFLIVFPKLCWIGRAWQYNFWGIVTLV